MTSRWAIEATGLTKRYAGARSEAVSGLDLRVAPATIHGILGPNGAGKTTTLAMICGLVRPDGGRIRTSDGDPRRTLGYVPQDIALYARLTGRENLEFFGGLYPSTSGRLRRRIDAALEMVGLTDRASEPVERYSAGMQRRLNLAAGLLHEPAILLLDEPTAGIDVQSRARIFETVRGLRDAGTTILYTTHHMEDARRLCDRITLMDGGRIVLEGEPERIVRDRGRFTLRMALDRVTDELVSEVAALDEVCDVRPGPGRLSISLVHRGDGLRAVSRIGEIALAHGIELTLEGTVETDLEAVFLDLTGHGLRDRHGGPA